MSRLQHFSFGQKQRAALPVSARASTAIAVSPKKRERILIPAPVTTRLLQFVPSVVQTLPPAQRLPVPFIAMPQSRPALLPTPALHPGPANPSKVKPAANTWRPIPLPPGRKRFKEAPKSTPIKSQEPGLPSTCKACLTAHDNCPLDLPTEFSADYKQLVEKALETVKELIVNRGNPNVSSDKPPELVDLIQDGICEGLASKGVIFQDVVGDGHCGFRCIALLETGAEENWPIVRLKVMKYLLLEWLKKSENLPIDSEYRRALCFEGLAPMDHWFNSSITAIVSAIYRRPIICLNNGKYGKSVFLHQAPLPITFSPWILWFTGNHYKAVHMDYQSLEDFPPVDRGCGKFSDEEKNSWRTLCHRLKF